MIIYEANETDFFSNGLGTLPDATSALVTEERNGEFVLDIVYPQQGLRSELLAKNRIIKADAGHELKDQRFVIKKVTPTMDSDGYIYLTVHAEHVSYITADLGVTPNLTLSGNATQALEQWQASLVGGHPDITVDSDIISEHETNLDITKATNARQVLGGVEGSILDVWGGEYKFDNLHISLRGQRGTTANTLISYGRNLLTFEQEDDITDTYTSIYPYANVGLADSNNSKLVTVDGYFVDSQYVDRYPNRKLLPVDFGSEFTDYKIGSKPSESDTGIYTTEAEIKKKLTELAKQYIENNRVGIPKVSTKITFADLSKTSEYAPLEQVNLCDIIPIRFEMLGIDTTIKVTRVVWDVLIDEYDSIELGDLRTTLGESISALESKTTGLANAVLTAQSTADNQNSIFRTNGGTAEPVAKKVGDLWFKTDGDYQYMYQWDGAVWHEVVNTKTTDDIAKEVDKAKADAEALSTEVETAKTKAQEAFTKAGFNADEISNIKTATSEVTETLTSTVRQTSELSESLKNVASETASRYSEVSSELSNTRDSLTAKASELASEVASNSESITKANSQLYSQSEGLAKVSQSAAKMEQTMTDLSGRVNTVETTASETKEALADAEGNITTLTKRADGTDTKIADAQGRVQTLESRADNWDLELSKKVDDTTYNAGIQNLGSQISLKADKTDLDGYATKAQLSVESDRITQQASAISNVTTIANNANDKIDGLRIGGRNLLKNSRGRFQPNGSKLDNWAIYKDTTAYLENGKTYTISAKAKDGLVFSNVHEPTKPSNKVVLWMVDAAQRYNVIVSDDKTDTVGTVFKWGYPTGTYQLRVNTYNADNLGYAERVQIQEGTRATEWQPSDLDLPDTIVSTVTTTTNAKQIVDSSGIYSEVTNLVDTKVGNVTTQLETYKHTVDDTGNKLNDLMGAIKYDPQSGKLTSNFNELIKTASGVEERYTQLNSKIDGLGGGVNLVPSGKPTDTAHARWWGCVVSPHSLWKNGKENVFVINNNTQNEKTASSDWITVERGETYTVSFWACMSSNCSNYDLLFLGRKKGETESFTQIRQIVAKQRVSGAMFEYRKFTFNVGQSDEGYLRFDNNSSTDGNNSVFLFTYVKMEKGTVATPWSPAPEDISTEIAKTNETIKTVDGNVTTVKNNLDKTKSVVTQLANLFDVTVGDSSISVTNGGVLVKGKQIHIDGQTLIDNASIDGAKIKSLDAGKITTGTLNAANVKVINLDANNITTGALTGPGMALDLNNGSFKINNSDNSLKVEMDSGKLRFYRLNGKLMGTISSSDWTGLSDDNQALELSGKSGAVLKTENFKMTNFMMSNGPFLTTSNAPSSNGSAVILRDNDVRIIGQTEPKNKNSRIDILAGKPITFKNELGLDEVLYNGIDIIGDEDNGGGVQINSKDFLELNAASGKTNISFVLGEIIARTADSSYPSDAKESSEVTINNGGVYFEFKKDGKTLMPFSARSDNTVHISSLIVSGDLSVYGNKNNIVQTTAGWTKINAYETAEYYFGDLGTAVTDDTSTVRIGIEPLFNETVNTNIPYQVFVTSYGEGYAWVAERGSNYFVIKSSVPNLEIGYEIKAKRKGYENVRLEIDKHMEANKQ